VRYLLDTNIVLIYTQRSRITAALEEKYNLFDGENRLYISVVTAAELKSFVLQRGYGVRKLQYMEKMLSNFSVIDINIEEILDRYAEIDAYSQGKWNKKRGRFSARNMGKNDLFIAATSSVYDLTLLTTDKDFTHLTEEFLELEAVDIEKMKSK